MSGRKKGSGAGFLLKLGLAALAALAASAIFRKKVLAPAPGNDYRLPSTPPANPSAAMGPEEATPLTEQEKQALASAMGIKTQGGAAVAEADASGSAEASSATEDDAGLLVDEVVIDAIEEDEETGAIVETIIGDTMITDEAAGLVVEEITTETIVSDPDTGEILSDDSSTETMLTDATTGEVLVDEIDLGDDGEESGDGGADDDGPEAMGIAAVPPIDALNAGDTSYWPAEGDHNCPDEFPVKGNASSRIYHLPGESSYDATIPEICFVFAEAAEAMGFRARKR